MRAKHNQINQFRWDAESICDSNLLSILSLLLAIANRFSGEGSKALVDLPRNLWVRVITVRRRDGNLTPEISKINLIK